MRKPHNLISVAIAVVTLVLVQVLSNPFPVFRFLIPAFLALVAVVTYYNWWYLKKIEKYNFWILLQSVLMFFGMFAIFAILPNSFLRGGFLICAVLVIAFFEFFIGNFSESIILNETLLMAFGFFVSLAAYVWYFPKYQILFTASVFAVSYLLSRSVYEFTPHSEKTKNVSSLILGLFCSEVFWVFTLLPFHFSAIGLMLFNVFYFCFILNYYYLINTLSYKKVQLHLIILVFAGLAILIATPWRVLT